MARRSSSPTTVIAATGCASSSRSFPRYCPPAPAELDAALAARSRGSARPTASPSRSSAGSRTAALGCTPAGALPYMSWRDIDVGDVPVRALRVTYVGELGWELYCPTEFGTALWRTVWSAGAEHGLVAGGYRAIDSLRLEKGYRVWGADDARAHLLPRARRPALGRAVERAGDGRRRRRRARDRRRLRLHGRALDRLRLPAAGARRAGDRSSGRDLRRVGRRAGGCGASVRPRRRARAPLIERVPRPRRRPPVGWRLSARTWRGAA